MSQIRIDNSNFLFQLWADPEKQTDRKTRKEPSMKKDSIMLTPVQRQSLEQILSKGKALAWTLKHAQVLLKVDRGPQGPGWSTSQIVEAYEVSRSTVERICRLFREQGLDAALFRRPQ